MIELARRRMMMGGNPLPYDAEVEYLKSDGTQYIKTDIIGTPSIDLYMDFQLLSPINNEDRKLIGNNRSVGLGILNNYFRVVADTFYLSSSLVDTNRHIFRTKGDVFYIDNVIISNKERVNTTDKLLYIFAMSSDYNRPDGKCGIMKMYECKLFDNYALVRHFIPVRVGNVGYMYDKVSGQLFGSQGTGQFIIGPDKTT